MGGKGACGRLPDWRSVLHEGRRKSRGMECKTTTTTTTKETEEGIEFTACFWKQNSVLLLDFWKHTSIRGMQDLYKACTSTTLTLLVFFSIQLGYKRRIEANPFIIHITHSHIKQLNYTL